MALPIHQRYEIIFLSQHSMGPKLSHTNVAKTVKCSLSTVKYWLKRWKQSKVLNDLPRSGRPRATTPKQDQQIVSLAEQQTFITSQDITNRMNRRGVIINERTVQRRLNEAGARYNRPLSKPLLDETHRKNRLAWARKHESMN